MRITIHWRVSDYSFLTCLFLSLYSLSLLSMQSLSMNYTSASKIPLWLVNVQFKNKKCLKSGVFVHKQLPEAKQLQSFIKYVHYLLLEVYWPFPLAIKTRTRRPKYTLLFNSRTCDYSRKLIFRFKSLQLSITKTFLELTSMLLYDMDDRMRFLITV